MRKTIILFSLLIPISSYCQQQKLNFNPFTIASPNVTSLGIFGVIPVNYYTGIPEISIPIYNLVEGNITVPILLKYHSAGFRPNQYPSWVGIGWALQAGGMITRTVNCWPDEKDAQGNNMRLSDPLKFGYYFNTYLLADSLWYNKDIKDVYHIEWDYQPDEFSFNFNGITGKFYLDHNKKWQVYSEQDIKVVCQINDIADINYGYYIKDINPFTFGGLMFYKFVLITADGTQYVFGGNRYAIEFTRPGTRSNTEIPTATTWNLTQIISPEGDNTIKFEYERAENDLILCTYKSINLLRYNLGDYCNSVYGSGIQYSTYMLEPSYLKSITSKHQKITISSSKADALPLNITQGLRDIIDTLYSQKYGDIKWKYLTNRYYSVTDLSKVGRKLSKLDISYNTSGNTSLYKSFVFKYIENNSERLKLKSLEETAPNTTNYPIYKFEYYVTWIAEPDYETQKIDHWGFYNYTESVQIIGTNYAAFMNDESKLSAYYKARNATSDPNVYLIGMLKKITYPTGGSTTFEYEPHDYSEFIQRIPVISGGHISGVKGINVKNLISKPVAGGLRIKRIISSPEDSGNSIIREYIYIKGYQFNDSKGNITTKLSSGQLQTELPLQADQGCIDQYNICKPLRDGCIDSCLKLYKHNPKANENCISYCPECNDNCLVDAISPYSQKGWYMTGTSILGQYHQFSANPFLPLSDKNGNHIVYSEVVEKMTNNGYSRFTYQFPPSGGNELFDELPLYTIGNNYYADLTSKINERGSLKSEVHCDEQGTKEKEVKYFYNLNPDRFRKNVRTRPVNYQTVLCENHIFQGGFSTSNFIYTYYNYLGKKIETDYSPNASISKTTTYIFGGLNDKLLKEETHDMSDGTVLITRYNYSTDYVLQPNFTNNNVRALYNLQQKHIIEPVEIIVLRKKDNINSLVEGKIIFYKTFYTNVIKPEKILLFETVKPREERYYIPFTINTLGNMNYDSKYYKERMQFNNYDVCGNLTEFKKTGDIPTSILYGYDNTFPIAKFSNLSYQTLTATIGQSTLKISDLNKMYYSSDDFLQKFELLYTLFPTSQIETYTYDVIKGITTQTNVNKQTTFYIYDNLGRLTSLLDQDKNILKTYDYHYRPIK